MRQSGLLIASLLCLSAGLLLGCDPSMRTALDYCYDLKECDPSLNKDSCVDSIRAEYDAYSGCEWELDDYYDCMVDQTCDGFNASRSCARYEDLLNRCESGH